MCMPGRLYNRKLGNPNAIAQAILLQCILLCDTYPSPGFGLFQSYSQAHRYYILQIQIENFGGSPRHLTVILPSSMDHPRVFFITLTVLLTHQNCNAIA